MHLATDIPDIEKDSGGPGARLSSDPSSPAVKAAIGVRHVTHAGENIRLPSVQAALVRRVDGGAPKLIVELNDWLADSAGIDAERTGIWHNITLNHHRTWVLQGGRYEPRR